MCVCNKTSTKKLCNCAVKLNIWSKHERRILAIQVVTARPEGSGGFHKEWASASAGAGTGEGAELDGF